MRTRERQGYDAFFRACYLPVVRTVHLVVHDRVLAEDVAQEAFYRLLKHWRTVSTYDLPEAWVRRVAIRIAVREVQRAAARAGQGATGAGVVPYDDLPDPDLVAGRPRALADAAHGRRPLLLGGPAGGRDRASSSRSPSRR